MSIVWEHIPLYQRISAEFAKFPGGDARDNFARAVERSFALDTTGAKTPRPASAGDIADEFGFSLVAQKKYGISLGKDAAFKDLLEPINAPVNTYGYKQLKADSYPGRFGRPPSLHNGKQMVLTVAEWLHFVPHEFSCPLPLVIQEHLKLIRR